MHILIAEDDFTSRNMLAAVLKKTGYEVVETTNGNDAWETMQHIDAPKLVILDWIMPQRDGLEVCRLIRSLETDYPPYIIMLTSKDKKVDIVVGLEAGADDYLAKPYDPGELCARVDVGRRMVEMQASLLEARDRLTHQATHDPLTGILNRRAILDALDKELHRAKRNGKMLGIGICDLDHFKQFNDQYGHQVGDEVLIGFTGILKDSLRQYDIIGRYGGEEFVVITPDYTEPKIQQVYERLCRNVAQSAIHTSAGNLSVTVSIGVFTGNTDDSAAFLLNEADAALYQAKNAGRNRVFFRSHRITVE